MTEIDLTPITRLEYDIDAILNDHAVAEPITRIELILADIVAGNTTTVEPVTRIETYLAIISGADYPVPEPVTRIETFLAIIAGEDYEEPEAVTRLEGLLAEWVEKGSGIWKTVTGTLIHITDALASPVKELSVAIEPLQSGSGDPSPTNVRPITGWTGCNIYVRNSNLLDYSKETVNYRLDNVGGLTSNSNYATSEFISVKPDKWYYFRSLVTSSVGYAIAEYTDKDPNTFIRYQQVGSGSSPKSTARQTSQTTNYIRVSYWKNHSGDPAVLYPSGNTEYVPYAGTTYPISWQTEAGTVYGGTLTINEDGSVDLVKTKRSYQITNVTLLAGGTVHEDTIEYSVQGASGTSDVAGSQTGTICDCLKTIAGQHVSYSYSMWKASPSNNTNFYFSFPSSTSKADAMEILNTLKPTFVLNLRNPVTYHLDSISQISTLAGENNIWADVNGDITLIYKAQSS